MRISILLLFVLSLIQIKSVAADDLTIEWPEILIAQVPATVSIEWTGGEELTPENGSTLEVVLNGQLKELVWKDGNCELELKLSEASEVSISALGVSESRRFNPVPLWMSIIPPILAIGLALLFKEVLSSLFVGIFFGTAVMGYYAEGWSGIFTGFLRIIDTYILQALNDPSRLSVIFFTMLIGGLVALVSKNGGMQGVVNRISRFANSARNAQFTTWALGIAIFFDDYANTLVVGNTMRPLTDKWRISREKLSYLVDSTAAPVAAIAFVTTWIGAELGYIGDGLSQINMGSVQIEQGAYSIFLSSLQYSFYPLFTLAFMLMLIAMRRDFGPMYKAEMRARTSGAVQAHSADKEDTNEEMKAYEPDQGVSIKSFYAIIPVSLVVLGTIAGLLITGYDALVWADSEFSFARKLSITIGNADSYQALLWASLLGLITAIGLTVIGGQMSLGKSMHAVVNGFKFMIHSILILALAWTLADVTEAMHTASFLQEAIGSHVAPWLVPAFTFILAALVSFSTGSSWGAMAILYPLILPLTWKLALDGGYESAEAMMIFYNTTACVLAGSVLGDHCSPISDTTILSSLATSCNHIDHVQTQMPYALTVGVVALLVGTIPGGLGLPFWLTFPTGILVMYLIVRYLAKPVPEPDLQQ